MWSSEDKNHFFDAVALVCKKNDPTVQMWLIEMNIYTIDGIVFFVPIEFFYVDCSLFVFSQFAIKLYLFVGFFQYGKDFDAIQKAIAIKHRKKGDTTFTKTKEQVRHLYYRTLNTVSKLLNSSEGKNSVQMIFNHTYLI